ncbi:MAG: Na/Pi symporter, partial [Oscillospiraceae bacterium]
TCVTSIISSIGANKNAKRTAMVHLYFNVIGTIIFFIAIYLIQTFIGFSFWDSPIDMGGISAVHIVFNVVTTAIFLPFTWVLEKLAIATVKDKKFENSDDELKEVATLDERFLRSPSMALSQCQQVVELMGEYAGKNFNRAVNLFKEYDEKKLDVIQDFEDAIDRMEDKINNYLVKLTSQELTEKENKTVTYLLKLVSEFERVGDYSINISDIAKEQHEESMTFSESALRELDIVEKAASEIINMAKLCVENNDEKICNSIEPLEETIDAMVEKLKARHIERLKTSNCTIDNGIRFLNILTNVERISDHCSNIGVYVISFNSKAKELDRHVFVENLHRGITKEYTAVSEMYYDKYMKNL